uniref:Uncharacterized protein n=1 Tax=Arundo donax TaxID=35708 RepID=A0A0A9F7L7_ARUDO
MSSSAEPLLCSMQSNACSHQFICRFCSSLVRSETSVNAVLKSFCPTTSLAVKTDKYFSVIALQVFLKQSSEKHSEDEWHPEKLSVSTSPVVHACPITFSSSSDVSKPLAIKLETPFTHILFRFALHRSESAVLISFLFRLLSSSDS